MLFHHRWATSTIDTRSACHPFSTKDYFKHQYIGVHNGVIMNDYQLEMQHQARGIQYVSRQPNGTFNDSEALIYDLARYFEGEVDELTARGSNAFVVIKRNKRQATNLLFGRNTGSPLKVRFTPNSVTIASEGDGDMVNPDTLYDFNFKTKKLKQTPMIVPTNSFRSLTTYGKDEHTWDDDRDYHIPDYTPGDYTDDEGYDYIKEFACREGTEAQVKQELLRENHYNFASAAAAASLEADYARFLANKTLKSIDATHTEEVEEITIACWLAYEGYSEMVGRISDNLFDCAEHHETACSIAEPKSLPLTNIKIDVGDKTKLLTA